jgi:hypothetical protein
MLLSQGIEYTDRAGLLDDNMLRLLYNPVRVFELLGQIGKRFLHVFYESMIEYRIPLSVIGTTPRITHIATPYVCHQENIPRGCMVRENYGKIHRNDSSEYSNKTSPQSSLLQYLSDAASEHYCRSTARLQDQNNILQPLD